MKKLIALAAAAALTAASLFAENTLHIGASFPISPFSADADVSGNTKTEDFSQTGVDFVFDYTHVADSGFAFKVGFDAGYVSSGDMKSYEVKNYGLKEKDDASGIDFAFGVGFGGSPIHNERMTLSIFGDFGFRYQTFELFSADIAGEHYEVDFDDFLFYIGPEVSYTFRFNNHIGLFANFGMFYNIGYGSMSYAEDHDNNAKGYFGDADYIVSGISFQPKIGLAVTF
ncbi:hypothetical protein [Treponema sp.]|uniref:hypothetical protein n=1 Tax=Treponema sp. TaxID=166 RepID=UPI00388F8F47